VILESSAHFDVSLDPDHLMVINRPTGGGARFVALDSLTIPSDSIIGTWQLDPVGALYLRVNGDVIELGTCRIPYTIEAGVVRSSGWPDDPTTCVDAAAGATEADVSAVSLALALANGDVSLALDGAGNLYVSGSLGDLGARHFVLPRSPI
jgi:hypothetical protein